MTRQSQPDPTGFLSDLTIEWLSDQTLLLTAHYHQDRFTTDLFPYHNITRPDRLSKAVPKRLAEFLAGRLLVQKGQTALGLPITGVDMSDSRAPVWPDTQRGSISHAKGWCAVILSVDLSRNWGVDCEEIAAGSALRAIQKQVLTPSEQARHLSDYEATCLFSAKEALFKALHPQVGRFFGFDAAEITGDLGAQSLCLALTEDLAKSLPKGRSFDVQHRRRGSHVLTWLSAPLP